MSNKNIYRKKSEKMKFTDHVSALSDRIKLRRLERTEDYESKCEIAETIKDDNLKIEAIKLIDENYTRLVIAMSIKDDNLKIETMKLFKEENERYQIASSIKDDNIKIKAIKYVENEYIIGNLLSSIDGFNKFKIEFAIVELYIITLREYGEQNIIENIKEKIKKIEEIKEIENDDEKIEMIKKIDGEWLCSEIATTLKDDNKKLDIITEFEDDWKKAIVAEEILDDEKKREAISWMNDDSAMCYVANTIENDDEKIKFIKSIMDDKMSVIEIVKTLKDDNKKLEVFRYFDSESVRNAIIDSIKNEDIKIEILEHVKYIPHYIIEQITDKNKQIDYVMKYYSLEEMEEFCEDKKVEEYPRIKEVKDFVKEIKHVMLRNDNEKVKKIENLNNERLKNEIVQKIKSDSKKVEVLKFFESMKYKMEIVNSINDRSEKLKCIEEFETQELKIFRFLCEDTEFIKDNMDIFILKEGFQDKVPKGSIEKLYKQNNEVLKNIDLRILLPEYIELFGMNRINLISCYPRIQEMILELSPKKLEVFVKCIDDFTGDAQTEEWTTIASEILDNLCNRQFDDLINSIENLEEVDIDVLKCILQSRNIYNIKSKEEISQYEQIKKEKTDKLIKSRFINNKKLAVLEKLFGHDIKYAQKILMKYGKDIDSLPECDMKYYVKSIQEIMNCTSSKKFKKIYDECKEVTFVDKAFMERTLKNEFGKLYNNGLLKVEDTEQLDENMYLAGTDFKMIITSVGAYVGSKKDKNYREDWNRPALSSQHFCTSYIRNDMIGTAPIKDICYGFDEMAEDSLMLSGNRDIHSTGAGAFVSRASGNERYYIPENQINKTVKYNEMDFRRIQNEEKKQPSYIVVFKRNGIIKNLKKAQKAQKDWDGIPIVVVDVDACLESEKNKVTAMITEYRETKNPELKRKIYYKIRNNRVTDRKFCNEIDIQEFKEEENKKEAKYSKKIAKKQIDDKESRFSADGTGQIVTESDLEENDNKVTSYERNEEISKMKRIFKKINHTKEEDIEIGEQ